MNEKVKKGIITGMVTLVIGGGIVCGIKGILNLYEKRRNKKNASTIDDSNNPVTDC